MREDDSLDNAPQVHVVVNDAALPPPAAQPEETVPVENSISVAPTRLFFVQDSNTGREYLVDSGAAKSLIPRGKRDMARVEPVGFILTDASNNVIPCYGDEPTTVRIGENQQEHTWTFVVADVSYPILGLDFLAASGFLIDPRHRRLLDPATAETIKLRPRKLQDPGKIYQINLIALSTVDELLSKHPNVLKPLDLINDPPKSSDRLQHHIRTGTASPVSSRFRRLEGEKLAAAKAHFDELLAAGIVRRSQSPWSSPLHLVAKADGTWRCCGDSRGVNNVTEKDKYPLRNMVDLFELAKGKNLFTKIDLKHGFYHIRVADEDVCKTAIITPFGLFEYIGMPFGLCTAAQTFQRYMDEVLQDLPNVACYVSSNGPRKSNVK
jgi:hypothetical protein